MGLVVFLLGLLLFTLLAFNVRGLRTRTPGLNSSYKLLAGLLWVVMIVVWIGLIGMANGPTQPAIQPSQQQQAVPPAPTNAPVAQAQPTSAPAPKTTNTPKPTDTPQPTSTPVPPKPTATPAPTRSPVPATKKLTIDFTGQFQPNFLQVGDKLVVRLGITNNGDADINGMRIFTDGPWDKYTVVNVMPGNGFECDFLGCNAYSGIVIPPGQTRYINIIAYPNEPGSHQFNFIPHTSDDKIKLVDENGDNIVIGGKVSVIR